MDSHKPSLHQGCHAADAVQHVVISGDHKILAVPPDGLDEGSGGRVNHHRLNVIALGQAFKLGKEQIRGFMREHPDTGLIIIDTLKRVREAGGADYSYASDYDVVARLKALADSYKVSMLIVHHTRKQKSEDIFDMISGTNGLMGAADGAFVLSKDKRTSNNATLDVAGRDQQDMKIHLVRDSERLVWNFAKSETEMWKEPPEPLLEKIADTLFSESDRWEGTASELCERLAVDIKPNVLSLRLSINASRLFRDYGIRYQNSRTHDGRKVSLWKETEQTA